MILLTRAEAEAVLGPSPTHEYSALEPAPLKDGTYVLPEEILADPANADVASLLADKVVAGNPDPALLWDMENPEDAAAYQEAALVWHEGGQQRAALAARTGTTKAVAKRKK